MNSRPLTQSASAATSLQRGLSTTIRRARPSNLKLGFPWRRPHIPRNAAIPSHRDRTGTNYDTAWARRWPSRLTRAVLVETAWKPVISYYARPQITGLDRLAQLPDEAVIFVANHRSHVDTPLLLTTIPEPWRHKLVIGAAADYFFRNQTTSVLSALCVGAIPIERNQLERSSADYAAQLVADGWSLLLYPEGGRSDDGWGSPFRAGAAYLANKCQAPVVPVFLAGTRMLLRRGKKWPTQSHTAVVFGDPMWPEPGERARSFNDRIERAVATLADEFASDWWQARRRFHADQTPSMAGPQASSWLRSWKHERVLQPTRTWPR